MTGAKSKETIHGLCPEVPAAFVASFLDQMDEAYLQSFSAEEISTHIRLSASLSEKAHIHAQIRPLEGNGFEITIVGFDYLSAFSVFCGLVSAFGLDIRRGNIFSFSKKFSGRSVRRIVDVLEVSSKPGDVFDESRQDEFKRELEAHAGLLARGDVGEARERLHRFLIERIERMDESFEGLASPIDLSFDNASTPDWTLLTANAEDTFGLLYALSNALAMRGININRVRIESEGGKANDLFFIANRWGRKITDANEQERLRTAVFMLKQFTRFLPEAADPGRALRHFNQFLDKLIDLNEERFPDATIAFLASSEGMNILAHLLGSSDFLWNDLLLLHFSELVPTLEDFQRTTFEPGPSLQEAFRLELRASLRKAGVETLPEKKTVLNAFKDRQLFFIDAAHLVQPHATLIDFSLALTDLGEVVLQEAARICQEHLSGRENRPPTSPAGRFAIFALGKFGGCEMGYASDLELMFVHDSSEDNAFYDAFARMVVDSIEARSHGIFHVDMRLRPYGEAGAWSTPFERFTKYYSSQGEAAPFERQALIKLRWIAGDSDLGRRVEGWRDGYTYSGTPWNWDDAMQLRRRQMAELVKAGEINVKYSAGGIVDIEYSVQYLQILNGADHAEIRHPTTLAAMDSLRKLQIIREDDFATLHEGYLFLRRLIDGLRIVRGDATDLVLPAQNSEESKSLARRLGYREKDRLKGAVRLAEDIRSWMDRVHQYFVTRFEFQRKS